MGIRSLKGNFWAETRFVEKGSLPDEAYQQRWLAACLRALLQVRRDTWALPVEHHSRHPCIFPASNITLSAWHHQSCLWDSHHSTVRHSTLPAKCLRGRRCTVAVLEVLPLPCCRYSLRKGQRRSLQYSSWFGFCSDAAC